MNNSEKVLKLLSNLIETGILTSQDAKKELINSLKFKRDNLIDKLQLVSREEFNVLKKVIESNNKHALAYLYLYKISNKENQKDDMGYYKSRVLELDNSLIDQGNET